MKKLVLFLFILLLFNAPALGLDRYDPWEEFILTDHPRCGASSWLQEEEGDLTYHALNLFDQDTRTAWVVGEKQAESGGKIWVEVEPGLKELLIRNGYSLPGLPYRANNRIKKAELQLWVALQKPGMISEKSAHFNALPALEPWMIQLEDTPQKQIIPLDRDWKKLQQEMDRFLSRAGAAVDYAWIMSLEIKAIYPGIEGNNTGLTSLSWNLLPQYTGPGGLGILDLRGYWENEKGSPWERLQLEWYPFYQGWTTWVQGEPYDQGVWEISRGRLKLYSHSKKEQFFFTGWPLEAGHLLLIEDRGEFSWWKRK